MVVDRVRRGDQRHAIKRQNLRFAADKYLNAACGARVFEQLQQACFLIKQVKGHAQPFHIVGELRHVEQMPLAFDDQRFVVVGAAFGLCECLLHQKRHVTLQVVQFVREFEANLLKGFTGVVAVQIVRRADQLAGREALAQLQQAVLNIALRRDHHHEDAVGRELQKINVAEYLRAFRRGNDARKLR